MYISTILGFPKQFFIDCHSHVSLRTHSVTATISKVYQLYYMWVICLLWCGLHVQWPWKALSLYRSRVNSVWLPVHHIIIAWVWAQVSTHIQSWAMQYLVHSLSMVTQAIRAKTHSCLVTMDSRSNLQTLQSITIQWYIDCLYLSLDNWFKHN